MKTLVMRELKAKHNVEALETIRISWDDLVDSSSKGAVIRVTHAPFVMIDDVYEVATGSLGQLLQHPVTVSWSRSERVSSRLNHLLTMRLLVL